MTYEKKLMRDVSTEDFLTDLKSVLVPRIYDSCTISSNVADFSIGNDLALKVTAPSGSGSSRYRNTLVFDKPGYASPYTQFNTPVKDTMYVNVYSYTSDNTVVIAYEPTPQQSSSSNFAPCFFIFRKLDDGGVVVLTPSSTSGSTYAGSQSYLYVYTQYDTTSTHTQQNSLKVGWGGNNTYSYGNTFTILRKIPVYDIDDPNPKFLEDIYISTFMQYNDAYGKVVLNDVEYLQIGNIFLKL